MNDMVDHPPHYTQGSIECIDAIESALGREGFIAFLRGQVIKYQWRMMGKSNPAIDNAKSIWYANKLKAILSTDDKTPGELLRALRDSQKEV